MPYQQKTRDSVQALPPSLGRRLAKRAIQRGVSVAAIAKETGASRTTVYSWFDGGPVSNAYRSVVAACIASLRS